MSLTIKLFEEHYNEWHKRLRKLGVKSEKAKEFLKEQMKVFAIGAFAGKTLDSIDRDSLFVATVARLPPSQRHRLSRSDFG